EGSPDPTTGRDRLARSTLEAARWLLGARLVREGDGVADRRVGRIVEVEAYVGVEDAASHARFGETARNRVMFGPPGVAYVYLVYGIHHCLNVVTEPAGWPAALLVRALEPLEGQSAMRVARLAHAGRRRNVAQQPGVLADLRRRLDAQPDARLASGPGLVTAAFSIDRAASGADLLDPTAGLHLELPDVPLGDERVGTSARIGVDYAAEPWQSLPWRLFDAASPSVSGRRSTEPGASARR
ncbi:MAG TPA: DNA-3-methyladenine glycosylase, partial [Candidatus Limnocylindrales bacterium]|nr:DNA-3-methyladenine glycosylase [Candidatus Limnocylindrales bacterium]